MTGGPQDVHLWACPSRERLETTDVAMPHHVTTMAVQTKQLERERKRERKRREREGEEGGRERENFQY